MSTTYALPARFKSWHEFYHRLVEQMRREGITSWNDDTELAMEYMTVEFGMPMKFAEIGPGFTIGRLKILAFDEIQRTMPKDRGALYDEVYQRNGPTQPSPVGWLDNLIREKNLSEPPVGS